MQERYGGAAQAMSNTVSGMLSTIKDNALIIGKNAFEPMYYSFKNTLTKIRDLSDSWRGLARTGGSGGILRNIFTQDTFAKIQLFSSNLRMLRQNFILLWLVLKPVLTTALQFGLTIFNMVLPPINALVRGVLLLAQWITSCGTAVKYFLGAFSAIFIAAWAAQILLHFGMVIRKLFIVKALAQVIIGLAKAIRVLALTIVASPWIGILVLAAGALLYLGLTSKKVSGWLTGLGSSLNKAFGADPSKEFNTKIKQTTGTTNEFNKKLAVSKESLDKMGDSAKDAAKKAKDALASFDEVFTLPEPKDEDSTGLDAGELDNINPTIPAIEIPEPELPNMDTSISAWVNNLKTTLLQKLKNALLGAGIGAAIGAVFGGILGGPGGAALGAKIGAAAGAIAGFFWDQLPTRIKTSVKTAGIGAGIGFVLGGIMGGPGGAAIGGALGALAGGIVGYFWDEIKKQFTQSVSIGAGVGAVVGTVVGTAFGGPLGGAIGAALGIAIGALVGHFWEDIKKFFTTSTGKGALAGAGVGSIIGTAFGGPLGFAIGGILGGIIGALVGRFWEDIKKFFNGSTGKGASAGAVVGGVVGLAFGGPLGAAIGAILGGIIGGLVGKFWKDILKFFSDTKIKFNNWVEDVSTSVLGKFGRTLEKIRTIWNNIVKIKDKIIEMKSIGPLDLSGLGLNLGGHASGGVFNKEHIARFAEGNKAEAIIPLENDNAMEPFVKAVASGVGAALAPLMVQQDNTSGDTSGSQQVLYVGTLIADDRGLRELDRRMRVIKLEEDRRR
jgi:hypothetical protein